MIRAMSFHMDGTLVQTEKLKALSYALAVTELCGNKIREPEVIDAFRDAVGRSRRDVATPPTRQAIHSDRLVDEPWIVDNPTTLTTVLEQLITERKAD